MQREASTSGRPRNPGAGIGRRERVGQSDPAGREADRGLLDLPAQERPEPSMLPPFLHTPKRRAGRAAPPRSHRAITARAKKRSDWSILSRGFVASTSTTRRLRTQHRGEVDAEVQHRAGRTPPVHPRPAHEEVEEQRPEYQLLHVEGPLEQRQRRAAVLDEGTFHESPARPRGCRTGASPASACMAKQVADRARGRATTSGTGCPPGPTATPPCPPTADAQQADDDHRLDREEHHHLPAASQVRERARRARGRPP